jgi:hypothetical protein
MANFSTKQYSWCDITVIIGGRPLEGATAVEYSSKRNKERLFGRGCHAHAIQGGNVEVEGKLELWQSELEALTRDAPNKDITRIKSFDITIAYTPDDDTTIVVDVIKGVSFTENAKKMAQGDTHMKVELPFIALDVQRQK